MKKKIFSVLLALVLVCSFSLVTAVPAAAVVTVPDRVTAITATADRLVALQGTDGGWDFDVTGLTEHSGTIPSSFNLFGVTALGLIDAYQETGGTAYFTAAENTADHLKGLSRATDPAVRFQTFDYRFLVEFSALSADGSYAAHALSEWNWVKTNVADYYADEKQETIYNFWFTHAGHGFAAWQAADCGLATLAMGDTSYASNMAAVLAGHLDEIAGDDEYRFIGWGHALEFLNAVDSTTYATEITSLISNLTGSQNTDGSWGIGENTEGYAQDAAYAIMGLAAVGEGSAAQAGADWLVTNQDYATIVGGWNNSVGDKEYSETDSEALQALAATAAPVTIGTDGYYSIQSAVDAATEGDTINVAAGTYDEQVVIGKSLTLQGAGDTTVIRPSAAAILTHIVVTPWIGIGGTKNFAGIIAVDAADGAVIVKNLKVDGVNVDSAPTGSNWIAGIVYSESAGTIDSVTVVNMETSDFEPRTNGIWMSAASVVSTVEVKNSTVDNYNRGGIYGFGSELTVDIHDNDVIGPGFASAVNVPNGIMLMNGVNGTVGPNNNISNHMYPPLDWSSTGIALWDVDGVTVEGNFVTDCDLGIALTGYTGASNNTIRDNILDGNPRAGIFFETPGTIDNEITFNTITNNLYGIEVFGSDSPTWTAGEEAGAGNVAQFNNIVGNTEHGVVNLNPAVAFDAELNWWGDISGPQHETMWGDHITNPGGTGDNVSDLVNYVPWLTRKSEIVVDANIAYFGMPVVWLDAGWNTFSTPIALDPGETIDGVTYPAANTWADYVALGDTLNIHATSPAYAFEPTVTPPWVPLTGDNADYPLKPCDAIYVRMAAADIAPILFSPEHSVPTKEVYQGWNLISLASRDDMPVNDALESLYKVPGDFTGYSQVVSPSLYQEPWVFVRDGEAIPSMCPTRGYWVFMENGPDTLAGFTFTPIRLH